MVMGKYLSSLPSDAKGQYAMVGFRIGNTLSENGTVSRGLCSKDENGNLSSCVERTKIARQADGNVAYRKDNKEDGEWVEVDENSPVSMNVWGFTPDYFEYSEQMFKDFLSNPDNMSNLKSEFFIPMVVNDMINKGIATCKVLDTTSKWFGVTYAEDRPDTVDRISKLVKDGIYPEKLF
jgi:hypothetical protein